MGRADIVLENDRKENEGENRLEKDKCERERERAIHGRSNFGNKELEAIRKAKEVEFMFLPTSFANLTFALSTSSISSIITT